MGRERDLGHRVPDSVHRGPGRNGRGPEVHHVVDREASGEPVGRSVGVSEQEGSPLDRRVGVRAHEDRGCRAHVRADRPRPGPREEAGRDGAAREAAEPSAFAGEAQSIPPPFIRPHESLPGGCRPGPQTPPIRSTSRHSHRRARPRSSSRSVMDLRTSEARVSPQVPEEPSPSLMPSRRANGAPFAPFQQTTVLSAHSSLDQREGKPRRNDLAEDSPRFGRATPVHEHGRPIGGRRRGRLLPQPAGEESVLLGRVRAMTPATTTRAGLGVSPRAGLARVDHLGAVKHQATAGHATRSRTGPRTRDSRARPDGPAVVGEERDVESR